MTTQLLLFAVFVFSMLLMSVNHKKKRKRIVFFGNSLTAQGAKSGGYIKRILQILRIEGIDDGYELIGSGKDGNTVTDLRQRVDKDVLLNGADVVVIMIGINDVWNKVDWVKKGTPPDVFAETYDEIIEKLLEASIKVVVCTLTVIGEQHPGSNNQDADLEIYSDIIRNLAVKHETAVVDLRTAFSRYIAENNPENLDKGILTTDTVHLNNKGNELVAAAIWKVLPVVMAQ